MNPVSYDGKKHPALVQHLESLGHIIVQRDANWLSTAPQAVIDNFTPADAKPYLKKAIEKHAADIRASHFEKIDSYERDSWETKRAQAVAFNISGMDADAPMLAAEALVRGIATSVVVARVLANSTAYQDKIGAISGREGRFKDRIDAATTWLAINNAMSVLENNWP